MRLKTEFKYLIFYLKMMFFNGKLDWGKSKFGRRVKNGPKINYSTGFSVRESTFLMNEHFTRYERCPMMDTSVTQIGDLYFNGPLEKFSDLNDFCSKTFTTKNNCNIIKTPSKYEFLKMFFVDKIKI